MTLSTTDSFLRYLAFTTLIALLGIIGIQPVSVAQSRSLQSFFQAIKLDNAREVQTILVRGLDPNSVNDEGQPALVLAAREKSWATFKTLIEHPQINLEQLNPQGENALMLASMHGENQAVEKMIDKGAEVNKTGWTPLHYAAAGGHSSTIKLLLENHAYIDAESPNKTTPIMMAARLKHVNAAELLVQEGADPTMRNQSGLSAADYLIRVGEVDKAKWMVEQARAFRRKYHDAPAMKYDSKN